MVEVPDSATTFAPVSMLDETLEIEDTSASRRLGHYQLLGELGRGGMGVVYAAHDTKLDRKVAIKQLRAEGRVSDRRRLIREAMAMARLSHPNVIPIYEIGERSDSTFIVMEYVEGKTLRGWLKTSRTRAEILAVFKAAARGLIAAHQKGLVHRDFKPDNVMIGTDGRVRVLDFGLARADTESIAADAGDELEHDTSAATLGDPGTRQPAAFDSLTRTGTILGTPAYMSPEQFQAQPADAASDQFSFCVALYEALHGERPFTGETLKQLCAAVMNGEIQEAPSDTSVPSWLREVVCRGLTAKPEDRFESMQGLLDALVEGELAHEADTREPFEYVFVAHDSPDKAVVLRLCEGLLDLGVRPWLDMWELPPGKDWRGPLEDALAEAPAVLVCHGSGDWARHEYAQALAARIERDPSTVYSVGLPGADGRESLLVGGHHESVYLRQDRWDETVVELARLVGVDRDRTDWLAYEAQHADLSPVELSPYRGLQAFHEQDARWMFGREQEVGELLDIIRAGQTRFLTLIGASGSGKSSLLMAGLCPALRNGALGNGRDWSIAYLRPGARPCEALAHALVDLQGVRDIVDDALKVKRLRDELLDSDDTLGLVMSRACERRVLLVVDQLEELFTEAGLGGEGREGEAHEALAFVQNLLKATQEHASLGGRLWIAATLRADFVQRGLEVGALARALKSGTYFALPPMGEQQIRAAIERPAKRVGFDIEPKLVEKLVGGATEQAARLPLLQHVLRELWQLRDEQRQRLSYEDYAETGGLEGAIAVAAERALGGLQEELGDRAKELTRRVMTRLVHLGELAAGDTRRRAGVGELGADEEGLDCSLIRLVSPPRAGSHDDAETQHQSARRVEALVQ